MCGTASIHRACSTSARGAISLNQLDHVNVVVVTLQMYREITDQRL